MVDRGRRLHPKLRRNVGTRTSRGDRGTSGHPGGDRLQRFSRPARGRRIGRRPGSRERVPDENRFRAWGRGAREQAAVRHRSPPLRRRSEAGPGQGRCPSCPTDPVQRGSCPGAEASSLGCHDAGGVRQGRGEPRRGCGRHHRGRGGSRTREAERRLHPGHGADRGPREPHADHRGQPRNGRHDAVDKHRLTRPDLCLLQCGRANPARGSQAQPVRSGRPETDPRHRGSPGAGYQRRVPLQGASRFRRQPSRHLDGHDRGPGRLFQSEVRARFSRLGAGLLRSRPDSGKRPPSGARPSPRWP